jgi:hypothetical protein
MKRGMRQGVSKFPSLSLSLSLSRRQVIITITTIIVTI